MRHARAGLNRRAVEVVLTSHSRDRMRRFEIREKGISKRIRGKLQARLELGATVINGAVHVDIDGVMAACEPSDWLNGKWVVVTFYSPGMYWDELEEG